MASTTGYRRSSDPTLPTHAGPPPAGAYMLIVDATASGEVDREEMTMRLGSQLLKYRFLELGTVHHEPRAPLRRTLDEPGPQYTRIAGGR